jgi:hypothetical protein
VYHIHVEPVPANGSCASTLAHHDPFIRGEATDCDASKPATCQVGDLSGKYGKPPAGNSSYSASYTDLYASLVPGLGSFFGNRSVVFHLANKTRIGCANFVQLSASATPGGASCSLPVDTSSTSSAAPGGSSGGSSSGSSSTDVSGQSLSQSTRVASPSSSPNGDAAATPSRPPIVLATTAGAPPERWVNSAALLGGVAAAALLL